jgi:heat shock protein HslJ
MSNKEKILLAVILVVLIGFYFYSRNTKKAVVEMEDNTSVTTPSQNDVVPEQPKGKLPAGSAPVASAKKIQGITWVWNQSLIKADLMAPKKPGAFTLTLGADGKATGKTDCDSYFATYQIGSEGIIKFGAIGATKMYCEGSEEAEFTDELSKVGRYQIDGNGNLMLLYPDQTAVIMFNKQ